MSKALTVIAQNTGTTEEEITDVLRGIIVSAKNQHGAQATNAELAVITGVCATYGLNPLVKECAAFISGGKLQIVVMIDGWYKLVNRQPDYDGVEFEEHFNDKGDLVSTTCKMYLKTRGRPVCVTEHMTECRDSKSTVWQKWPARMMRHKAFIQAARMSFGISEVVDDDEAARITSARQEKDITPASAAPAIDWQAINDMMAECADLDTLKGVAGGLRREMEINGTWAQHKDHMILLHAEHKERIEKAYNQPVELTGEVVDAEFTESADVDFGDGE